MRRNSGNTSSERPPLVAAAGSTAPYHFADPSSASYATRRSSLARTSAAGAEEALSGQNAGKGMDSSAKTMVCEEKGTGCVRTGVAVVGAFVPPSDGGKSAPFDVKSFGFMDPTTADCAGRTGRNAGGRGDLPHTPRQSCGTRAGFGTPRDNDSMAEIMSMGLPFGGGQTDAGKGQDRGKACAPTLAR